MNILRRALFNQPYSNCRISILSFTTSANGEQLSAEHLTNVLHEKLKEAQINVEDISGGCGAMFRVSVASSQFKGKTKVLQHRLITDILKDEIKLMHGIVIDTKPI